MATRSLSQSSALSRGMGAGPGKMSGELGPTEDLMVGCHFFVRGQSDTDAISQAFFTEVTGLEVEVEIQPVEEGGVNDHTHKLLGRAKVSDITLKNGFTNSNALWNWYKEVLNGTYNRKNISIVMVDNSGTERHRWNFKEALPIKWTGPQLKADQSAVAIQSLQLVHRGLIRETSGPLSG